MATVGGSTIPQGAKIGLSFNHGEIDHPIYGKAKPKGVIPLLLTQGQTILPAILFNRQEMNSIVQKLLPEYRDLYPDDLDEEISARLFDLVILIACIIPDCDFNEPAVHLALELYIIAFAADDLCDNFSGGMTMDFSKTFLLFDALRDVMGGKYKTIEELPLVSPDLEGYVKVLWNFLQKCEKTMPMWETGLEHFRRSWEEDLMGHMVMSGPAKEFSASTQDFYRTYASGGNGTLQFIGWIRNHSMPEGIEENIMYQRMRYNVASCSNLLNDVIGLGRDIRKEQVNDTTILSAASKGMDLQVAFDKTYGQLLDSINDTEIGVKYLRELYRGDQNVERYLRLIEHYVDGQVIWYSMIARYGDTEPRIVKI